MATVLSFLLFLLVSFSISTPSASVKDELTAYEASKSEFSVHLNGSCTFSIDSYELKYKSTITGVITKDKISSLSGIKVKVWFLWLSIVTVVHDGDDIEFSVGVASADFAVSNFVESPTCGCGFDCVNVNERKIKVDDQSLVSSA
ncbi:uncharacterized protein LOC126784175 [Argentina anserina]|uniref:uncharacterized protein LOC126784175 n=1 Tax=Argentina anserina TaxID=57926 RepID=UPI0021767262|nr:uncharacterized protein LOC126784175 [Potentilla anserina]